MKGQDGLLVLAGLANLGEQVARIISSNKEKSNAKEAYEGWKSERGPIQVPQMPGKFSPTPPIEMPRPITPEDYAALQAALAGNQYAGDYLKSGDALVRGTEARTARVSQQEAARAQKQQQAMKEAERQRDMNLKTLELVMDPKFGNMELNPAIQGDPRYIDLLRSVTETGTIPPSLDSETTLPVEGPLRPDELRAFETVQQKIPTLTKRSGKGDLDMNKIQYFVDQTTGQMTAFAPNLRTGRIERLDVSQEGEQFVRPGTKKDPRTGTRTGGSGLTKSQKVALEKLHQQQLRIGGELKALSEQYRTAGRDQKKKLDAQRAGLEAAYRKNKADINAMESFNGGGAPAAGKVEINPLTGQPIGKK